MLGTLHTCYFALHEKLQLIVYNYTYIVELSQYPQVRFLL